MCVTMKRGDVIMMVTYEEAKEIYDSEDMREQMLKRLSVAMSTIDQKLRNKDCEFNWSRNSITVTLHGQNEIGDINLTDDDAQFICDEYENYGKFPKVRSSGNSITHTLAISFYMKSEEE